MVANESVTRRAVYMHPKQQKFTNENWDLTYSLFALSLPTEVITIFIDDVLLR